jgi:hypothetical protein
MSMTARATGETYLNRHSSRSHLIFQLWRTQRRVEPTHVASPSPASPRRPLSADSLTAHGGGDDDDDDLVVALDVGGGSAGAETTFNGRSVGQSGGAFPDGLVDSHAARPNARRSGGGGGGGDRGGLGYRPGTQPDSIYEATKVHTSTSVFSFVDLAGSERLKDSGSAGLRKVGDRECQKLPLAVATV